MFPTVNWITVISNKLFMFYITQTDSNLYHFHLAGSMLQDNKPLKYKWGITHSSCYKYAFIFILDKLKYLLP